jgi:drug/metabolite transporter (DMT)-like permease
MKPSRVMPFGYLSVITSFLADLYIFEADFNFWTVIGIILTSLGLIGKFLLEK